MRVLAFLFLGVLNAVTAKADIVLYTVTPSGGQFSFELTLVNTGAGGGTLYDLFLAIPLDISGIDTTTIGTPVGWGDPTGGLLFFGTDVSPATSFIEWAATSSGVYNVRIGSSLNGFSFISSQEAIAPILFGLNGSTTLEPADEVPEPTGLPLTLAVIACSLVFVNIKKKPPGSNELLEDTASSKLSQVIPWASALNEPTRDRWPQRSVVEHPRAFSGNEKHASKNRQQYSEP